MSKEDAVDCSKWRKFKKDVWWSGWVWVGECFFWYQPTRVVLVKELLNSCVRVTSLHKFDQTTSTSQTGFVTFSTDWRHYTLCWPSQDRSWRPAAVVHRCGPSACSCRRTHWDRWRAATVQCGHNPTARTANPDHCQRINTETVKLRQKTKQRWPFPAKYIGWSEVTESMVTIRSPFCGYNTI